MTLLLFPVLYFFILFETDSQFPVLLFLCMCVFGHVLTPILGIAALSFLVKYFLCDSNVLYISSLSSTPILEQNHFYHP